MTADYSPVKFLGATVIDFNSSLGWNDDVSRLTVKLVEDDDDAFNPPEVGYTVYFDFGGWQFNGLLERWTRSYSTSGNPIYEVSIVDPRQLLDGVAVILDDYNGTVPIVNVLNVYGYLESFGFGTARRNDSGLPYLLVIGSINALVNSVITSSYGGSIAYKGQRFALDITNLPVLPPDYRVGGSSTMTLMELLRDICDSGGCDMFFRCEVGATGVVFIKLYTISRLSIPDIGVINQFVETTSGAVSKEAGLEMVNDTCAKMVFGGKKSYLYYQTYGGGEDLDEFTGSDNPIWPFWGRDIDGNLVVANGTGHQHHFILDSRGVPVNGFPRDYPTDVGEMIAVLNGYSYWTGFLAVNWANQYYIDANGDSTANFLQVSVENGRPTFSNSAATYRHSGVLNPHFKKIFILGITPSLNFNLASILWDMPANTIVGTKPEKFLMNNVYIKSKLPSEEIHELLQKYAQEYYGRKYMVRVPNVYVKIDSDTKQKSYSAVPTNSAFLDDNDVISFQNNQMLPIDINAITDTENRIECFIRFPNINTYNFSNIPKEEISLSADGQAVFIKCVLEPDFVFLNQFTFSSPRVVVTLPGIIGLYINTQFSNNVLTQFLLSMVQNGNISTTTSDDVNEKFHNNTELALSRFQTAVPLAVTPPMAVVPIESQTQFYGPWYLATSIGKTEVEQDDSLVPWNYGSTTLMNLAGNARVSELGIRLQTLEYGAVEYPGVPVLNLGDQLLSVGPYVTDITADVSAAGITTRYNMKSWSPRFGKMAKSQADRFFRIRKAQIEFARQMREIARKKRRP